jgi:hypothetical protein
MDRQFTKRCWYVFSIHLEHNKLNAAWFLGQFNIIQLKRVHNIK